MKLFSKRRAAVVAVTALVLGTATVGMAAAAGSGPFDDVSSTHTHVNGVTWAKDNGVTKGCNPPSNTKYCPDNATTRAEMGTFMQRMAGSVGAIHVFKGTKVLGPLTSGNGWETWYLNEASGELALASFNGYELYFTTTGCTGTPYYYGDPADYLGSNSDTVITFYGSTQQWMSAGAAKSVTAKSSLFDGTCNTTGGFTDTMTPLAPASPAVTLGRK